MTIQAIIMAALSFPLASLPFIVFHFAERPRPQRECTGSTGSSIDTLMRLGVVRQAEMWLEGSALRSCSAQSQHRVSVHLPLLCTTVSVMPLHRDSRLQIDFHAINGPGGGAPALYAEAEQVRDHCSCTIVATVHYAGHVR